MEQVTNTETNTIRRIERLLNKDKNNGQFHRKGNLFVGHLMGGRACYIRVCDCSAGHLLDVVRSQWQTLKQAHEQGAVVMIVLVGANLYLIPWLHVEFAKRVDCSFLRSFVLPKENCLAREISNKVNSSVFN